MATTNQLNMLASDSNFRERVRVIVMQQAAVVYAESAGINGHGARAAFAVKVLNNPGEAEQLAQVLVTRTNLSGSAITFDYAQGHHVTDATDAAILAQVASDWSMYSGV